MNFNSTDADERDEAVLNITAMVDVVFILLAFFVLSARFIGNERDVVLGRQVPAQTGGAAAEDLPGVIPVYLTRDQSGGVAIRVGDARLGNNQYDAITLKLAEINVPQVPVAVAADPSLSVDQVARAVDAVLASPMQKVSLNRLDVARSGEGVPQEPPS